MRNPDQRFALTIRKRRKCLKQTSQVVGMRIEGKQINVCRKLEVIRYLEITNPGRDVEFIVPFHLNQNGKPGRRVVCEVDAEFGRNLLFLARGLEMKV